MSKTVRLNIPEPERYPRMTAAEIELVKNTILEGHKNILIAFRSDIRNFKTLYKDCYVVLTPFILYCYKRKERKPNVLELMARIYLADVKLIAFSREQYTLVISDDTSLVITAQESLRVAQLLYRNYQIVYSNLTIEETCELRSYDMRLFPPVKLPLSNSQKFQFAYAALCAKQQRAFRNEVVRYLHSMVLTGNGVFDIAELPVDIFINPKDIVPVLQAVDYMKFTCGFCCVDVKIPQLLIQLANIVSTSSKIRILHFNNNGMTKGIKDISDALKANRDLPIAYWSLDGNVFEDFDFFPIIVSAQREPIKLLSLNNCGLKAAQTQSLFDSLEENPRQNQLQVLKLHGAEYSNDCIVSMDKFLESRKETLVYLDLGGVKNGGQAIMGLLRRHKPPIKELCLSGTTLNLAALEDLLQFIRESETLYSLDISDTGLTPKNVKDVIETIAINESITRFDLTINKLGIHGAQLLPMFGAFLESDMDKWRSISMDSNDMDASDLRNILPLLVMMPRLRNLSLSYNFSSNTKNIDAILPGIADIPSLTTLVIKGDEKHRLGTAIYPLIENIASKRITKLDFSGNNIGDQGCTLAVQALKASPNMVSFNISDNNIMNLQAWLDLSEAVVNSDELIDFRFNVQDITQVLKRSKFDKTLLKNMSELQTKAIKAVAARRRRKGLGSQFIEQEDYVHVAVKFEGGHTHSAVSKEFNLPLPFQREGELVEDGGEIREIDIGDMAVYETDSMRYVIEEDVSLFQPPEIETQVVRIDFDSKGNLISVPNSPALPPKVSDVSSNQGNPRLVTFVTPPNSQTNSATNSQLGTSPFENKQILSQSSANRIVNEFMNGSYDNNSAATSQRSVPYMQDDSDDDVIQTRKISINDIESSFTKKPKSQKRRVEFDSDEDSDNLEPRRKREKELNMRKKRVVDYGLDSDSDDDVIKESPIKKRRIFEDDEEPKPKQSTTPKKKSSAASKQSAAKPEPERKKRRYIDDDDDSDSEDQIKRRKSSKAKREIPQEKRPKRRLVGNFDDDSDSDDEDDVVPKKAQKPAKKRYNFDDDSDEFLDSQSKKNKKNKKNSNDNLIRNQKPKRRIVQSSDEDDD